MVTSVTQEGTHLRGVWVRHRDHICLGLLIMFWIVNNALRAYQDTTPAKYDDSRYLYVSLKQLAVIRDPWQQVGELMNISHNGRPPLYTLVAQPLYLLAGTSEVLATVATNALFIVILVLCVYAIGKRLFDARTGLLAAFLLVGYPTLTVVSRRYLPHFAAVAMIALGAYLLLRTEGFRSTRYTVLFGLATGLGMLTSAHVAFGLLGLGVWIAFRSLYQACRTDRPGERRKALLKVIGNIVLALAIALALLLPWYLRHGQRMLNMLQFSYERKWFAPVEDVLSVEAFLWYLLNMHQSISVFLVPPFVIGVVAALVRPKARSMTLLGWVGSSYLLLSLPATKTLQYHFIMIFPAVALLSAFWLFQLRQRALRLVLVGLLVLISGCVFLETAWQLGWTSEQLYAFGVSAAPPLRENWHVEDILALVGEDCQGESASLLIVGDIQEFFAENFQYQALRTGFDGSIWGCRRAEPESFLNARYIAVLLLRGRRARAGRWGITPCHTWTDLLRNPPESFLASHSLLGIFPLPKGSEARVYKLTRPPSTAEAVALLEEIVRLNPEDEEGVAAIWEMLGIDPTGDSPRPSLGDVVAFVGYDIQPGSVGAGGTVDITLWWQALAEMDRDYTVFIHVLGPDDRIWAQQDKLLQHGGRPTSIWEEGEIAGEWYKLELPADTPPGEYVVKVGIYYWETGERLPVWDENGQRVADDAILLEPITATE